MTTFRLFDFLSPLNILFLQAELVLCSTVHLKEERRDSMKEDLEAGDHSVARASGDVDSINECLNVEYADAVEKDGLEKNEMIV